MVESSGCAYSYVRFSTPQQAAGASRSVNDKSYALPTPLVISRADGSHLSGSLVSRDFPPADFKTFGSLDPPLLS
jgi:hypothetical protein